MQQRERVCRECPGDPGAVLSVVLPRRLLEQPRPFRLCARRASDMVDRADGVSRLTTVVPLLRHCLLLLLLNSATHEEIFHLDLIRTVIGQLGRVHAQFGWTSNATYDATLLDRMEGVESGVRVAGAVVGVIAKGER